MVARKTSPARKTVEFTHFCFFSQFSSCVLSRTGCNISEGTRRQHAERVHIQQLTMYEHDHQVHEQRKTEENVRECDVMK